MPKTPSDCMKQMIGEYAATVAILQSTVETQQEQIAELQKTIQMLEEMQKDHRS